ncbi:hypothetical protein Pyn_31495 [Prunus yedoensis var. nudiflora]|uniref:malate dehydrogenase n=1 Tax=Prunus yedoensis var. nudiflora TaxID=2094558 RepID=A0A314U9A6_PRUYE|nr:hypothetical protein Pyn_31495 [Prunus yedoensis var. nudiflora]
MGATSAAATSSEAPSYKVALLRAVGEIREPLALLIKMSPWISALHLYDTKDVTSVTANLSHCDTPAQVPNIVMLPMMTRDDLFNINASTVKKLVDVVVDNYPKVLIHIINNSRKSLVSLTDDEVENLTVKIQNSGTGVVEDKGGAGFATLSMAYAATRFIESSLRALDGDEDVYECSYVESNLTELTFFASRVKLGRNEIKALVPYDLQDLTEYEQKALEALKPKLKASIENGIAFANKQAVTA